MFLILPDKDTKKLFFNPPGSYDPEEFHSQRSEPPAIPSIKEIVFFTINNIFIIV